MKQFDPILFQAELRHPFGGRHGDVPPMPGLVRPPDGAELGLQAQARRGGAPPAGSAKGRREPKQDCLAQKTSIVMIFCEAYSALLRYYF